MSAKTAACVSPGCTTGPFFPREFSNGNEDLTGREARTARGEHILLTGQVLELNAKPAIDLVLEIWQPDANGIFRHPLDPRALQADPGFWGWGRARTSQHGWYRFRTVLPGSYRGDDGADRCPHINCAILGIGLTRRLVTTAFFSGTPDMVRDPVLDCVPDATRRRRLFANRDPLLDAEGLPAYRFDIILRGPNETPFFVD
jgi:protocatechuate 3,4-dioxygenase alpha subunit